MERAAGRGYQIDAGTPSARQPLARLKPRQFATTAATPSTFFRIDESGFGDLNTLPTHSAYEVEEIATAQSQTKKCPENATDDLIDVEDLKLPTLPTVALQMVRLLDHDDVSVATLSKVVMTDPSIAAKLMRAANSALYVGRGEIRSAENAIQRLGIRTTRQLVVAYAVREVFHVKSIGLRKRMEQLWEHSTEVAAIANVLARELGGFDPDEAQLAGLLHQVGIVPVLHYASSKPESAADTKRLDWLCSELAPALGERVLRSWNFHEDLIAVSWEGELWWRDPAPEPELADLIIVAKIASFISKPTFADLPPMARLPAFQKTVGKKNGPTRFNGSAKGRGASDPGNEVHLVDVMPPVSRACAVRLSPMLPRCHDQERGSQYLVDGLPANELNPAADIANTAYLAPYVGNRPLRRLMRCNRHCRCQ
jgi:HD-like signal output (HDOD) protein